MNNNDWLDIDVLEDYLDGKLDAKAMHRVERLSLEDPFVAEALAGLSLSPKRVQSLSLLQKQLQDRITQKPIERKRWQITSQRLSIAAAAAVLFVTVSLLFWMKEKNNREQIAGNTPKKVEVAIAPVDTTTGRVSKNEKEIKEIVATSKPNSYASRKVVKPSPMVIPSPTAAVATPEAIAEKEVFARSAPAALAGRVAGLKIQNSRNLISGIVVGEDKQPVIGASVKLAGASAATLTNSQGEFSLRLDTAIKNPQLNVVSLGFMPKQITAKENQNLSIELEPDQASLSEVVVVGYGKGPASADKIMRPDPVGGWDKFQEYLINNNKLLNNKQLSGKYVTVSFSLDKNGSPINIKSSITFNTQQVTTEELKEAVRLIKEGPKWILPAKASSSLSTSVNIKF